MKSRCEESPSANVDRPSRLSQSEFLGCKLSIWHESTLSWYHCPHWSSNGWYCWFPGTSFHSHSICSTASAERCCYFWSSLWSPLQGLYYCILVNRTFFIFFTTFSSWFSTLPPGSLWCTAGFPRAVCRMWTQLWSFLPLKHDLESMPASSPSGFCSRLEGLRAIFLVFHSSWRSGLRIFSPGIGWELPVVLSCDARRAHRHFRNSRSWWCSSWLLICWEAVRKPNNPTTLI